MATCCLIALFDTANVCWWTIIFFNNVNGKRVAHTNPLLPTSVKYYLCVCVCARVCVWVNILKLARTAGCHRSGTLLNCKEGTVLYLITIAEYILCMCVWVHVSYRYEIIWILYMCHTRKFDFQSYNFSNTVAIEMYVAHDAYSILHYLQAHWAAAVHFCCDRETTVPAGMDVHAT